MASQYNGLKREMASQYVGWSFARVLTLHLKNRIHVVWYRLRVCQVVE